MSTTVNWTNPYADRTGKWLKGNLHTHTSPASGCGQVPLEETLALYTGAGYDFLSISDHMKYTDVRSDRLVTMPGIEWNAPEGRHIGLYACRPDRLIPHTTTTVPEEVLASLTGDDTLLILNHPNWQLRPHYRREELLALTGYDGIEIFNGVIKRLHGYEIATDKWDYLLANGRRVLGFACDDFHAYKDLAQGWNVVRAPSVTPEAIFTALKTGNFYCSSGVTLTDIRREGDQITVESDDGQEIQVIGDGGRLLQTTTDRAVTVEAGAWNTHYLRFAVYGTGSAMAWTQPFFAEE